MENCVGDRRLVPAQQESRLCAMSNTSLRYNYFLFLICLFQITSTILEKKKGDRCPHLHIFPAHRSQIRERALVEVILAEKESAGLVLSLEILRSSQESFGCGQVKSTSHLTTPHQDHGLSHCIFLAGRNVLSNPWDGGDIEALACFV